MKDIFLVSGLWIIFCIVHSALISSDVIRLMKIKLGNYFRYYRIIYNLIAIILFLPAIFFTFHLRQEPFFVWDGWLINIKYLLLLIGIVLIYLGARKYSMSIFIGIKQLKAKNVKQLMNKTNKLNTGGILSIIRHPFYTATFCILWARNLDIIFLATNCILSLYLIIGTFLEEKKLIQEFGHEYIQYKKEVSMFFPFKWIRRMFLKGLQ